MPNRLLHETSPYLQQHAHNPVDWHPWDEQALNLARERDQPILLSIGYSACHWCHVMAHESFEDVAVAKVMNELFINIKVDREERPDLDQIYQTAHAMLTQRSGGWPLTMFLLPDQTPFFGGTYFPKTTRQNMPGFIDLLPQVASAYHSKRAQAERHAHAIQDALTRSVAPGSPGSPTLSGAPLEGALRELKRMFDETHGGIGSAPKFPHVAELEFCLRRAHATHDEYAHGMVKLTLTKMAEGGIFDQLGGGFCRYSVDDQWAIPHFEKMLYDNGPLLRLYSDLWLTDRQPLYARVVAATAQWVMREMQSPEGGYYSSLDADSEHEEGKFYVWTPSAVKAALSAEEYALVAPHLGLEHPPNFEGRHWNLRVMKPLAFLAKRLNLTADEAQSLLATASAKLLSVRGARVRPGRDEKILASWNALMIKGMTGAARVFERPEWLDSARRALDFIREQLWLPDVSGGGRKRLLATYKDGKAHLNAYLDDYAFLLDALLELMQSDLRAEDLLWARELAELLLTQFEDSENGGFFFVSHDHERLIVRTKTGHDNATPSGNGVAAYALQRLGHLLGESRYLDAAQRTLVAFKPAIEQQPSAHASLCVVLEEFLNPPTTVILHGGTQGPEWQRELNSRYLPHAMVASVPTGLLGLPNTLDRPWSDQVKAWVCHGTRCLPPIATLEDVIAVVTMPVS